MNRNMSRTAGRAESRTTARAESRTAVRTESRTTARTTARTTDRHGTARTTAVCAAGPAPAGALDVAVEPLALHGTAAMPGPDGVPMPSIVPPKPTSEPDGHSRRVTVGTTSPIRPRTLVTPRTRDCPREPRNRVMAARETERCVTVAFDSPSGGVGVSLLAGLCAVGLARGDPSLECALADCDFDAGGMDVMLGIESEPGLRWSGVRAPLGRMDGASVMGELPRLEGVGVLAADPWSSALPGQWEVEAALRGLRSVCDVLLMDRTARGVPLGRTGESADVMVLVMEMSVLGLARARSWLRQNRERGGTQDGKIREVGGTPARAGRMLLVGAEPRGLGRAGRRHAVDRAEAEDYLCRDLAGVLPYERALHASVLDGLGIRSVPRQIAPLVDVIVATIADMRREDGHG